MKFTSKLARRALRVGAILMCFVGTALGNVDMFLKIDDVKGESRDDRHKGESEISTWSWGLSRPSEDLLQRSEFIITKAVDIASPFFQKACATGKHYDRAVLTLRSQGVRQVEFTRIVLEDVNVAGILIGMSQGETVLMESISLRYARAGVEYFTILPGEPTGDRIEFAWDFALNRKGGVTFPGTVTPTDADGDGMLDDWERLYGLDPTVNDARLDKDGDGATNFEEFVAGSSPADRNKVFRSTLTLPAGGGTARLSWSSAPGKSYKVLIGALLGEPFVTDRIVVSAGDGTTSVDLPAGAANRFYRVEVIDGIVSAPKP